VYGSLFPPLANGPQSRVCSCHVCPPSEDWQIKIAPFAGWVVPVTSQIRPSRLMPNPPGLYLQAIRCQLWPLSVL